MLELILGLVFPWGLDILRFDPTWLNLEVRIWRIRLVTNILWLCHRASVAPRWHSTCRSPVTLCVFLRRRFCTCVSGLSVSPIARVRHRSTAPPLSHPFCPRVPSVTRSGLMFCCHYQHVSRCDSAPTPLHQFKGHESRGFWSAVYKSTYNMIYPLPHFSVRSAEEIRQGSKPISAVRSALILSQSSRM